MKRLRFTGGFGDAKPGEISLWLLIGLRGSDHALSYVFFQGLSEARIELFCREAQDAGKGFDDDVVAVDTGQRYGTLDDALAATLALKSAVPGAVVIFPPIGVKLTEGDADGGQDKS